MARPVASVEITPEERAELRQRSVSPTSSQRDALRARIVLLRSQGHKESEVAHRLGVSINTVSLWSYRIQRQGLAETPGPARSGPQAVAGARKSAEGDYPDHPAT